MKTIFLILCIMGLTICAYKIGRMKQYQETLNKALKIGGKQFYTYKELDYIIFNEKQ